MTDVVKAEDGVEIAFEKAGDGPAVVLVHGFASNRTVNWRNTGWFEWLARSGHSVVAFDCRGHGESGKPHDREAYHEERMVADVALVMDACGVRSAPVLGYSMGAYLTIAMMRYAPDRISAALLGGVGENYFSFWEERNETIAQGLLAPDSSTIADSMAIEFRDFSERAGNDLVALAACMRRKRLHLSAQELGALPQPVLVVCGENDPIAGPAEPFARHFAQGMAVTVPRRNHHSTVGDRLFKDAARDFLAESH